MQCIYELNKMFLYMILMQYGFVVMHVLFLSLPSSIQRYQLNSKVILIEQKNTPAIKQAYHVNTGQKYISKQNYLIKWK